MNAATTSAITATANTNAANAANAAVSASAAASAASTTSADPATSANANANSRRARLLDADVPRQHVGGLDERAATPPRHAHSVHHHSPRVALRGAVLQAAEPVPEGVVGRARVDLVVADEVPEGRKRHRKALHLRHVAEVALVEAIWRPWALAALCL